MAQVHTYTSELGDKLVDWFTWCQDNLTETELKFFMVEEMNDEKNEFYRRWLVDQKITGHVCTENSKIIFNHVYDGAGKQVEE